MTIYLLTPDPPSKQIEEIEKKLQAILPELRKIITVDDIAKELASKTGGRVIPELRKIGNIKEMAAEVSEKGGDKIIVIFVSPYLAAGGIDNLIGISSRYRERIYFILVSNEISGNDYKRLIGSGGADWVSANSSLDEISQIIDKQNVVVKKENAGSVARTKKTILSFLPSLGGVGNTTIALEVALQIKLSKKSPKWKVCYFDFDFQTSHACDFLDIEPRLKIHEIFDQPGRLDEQLLELFISRHSSGLDVFAVPRNKLNPCDANLGALDSLLEMISNKYDFVVFDMPVTWFGWTAPTLMNSDAIILTGINTIPCLRQMRATLDAILDIKTTSTQRAIVINRVTQNLFGRIARKKHVTSVFAEKNIFYIQEDPYAVERVNSGTPATVGGNNRYVKDFTKLAAFCVDVSGDRA